MTPIRNPIRTLTLALKAEYFDAIRDGSKLHEFRKTTPYWTKRLVGRDYDVVELTKGYPRSDDTERRIRRQWNGFDVRDITHPHFGPDAVEVFAIDVSEPART